MTTFTDRTITGLARNRSELRAAMNELQRIRVLIDRALHRSSMTPAEHAEWRREVEAVLAGTGIKLGATQ